MKNFLYLTLACLANVANVILLAMALGTSPTSAVILTLCVILATAGLVLCVLGMAHTPWGVNSEGVGSLTQSSG